MIAVATITCWVNLMNDNSGEKAHRTLTPANTRYARRQRIGRGENTLLRKPGVCIARMIAIRATTGQNNLFSLRVSMMPCSALGVKVKKSNIGETTKL
jgi:hypothetical protein